MKLVMEYEGKTLADIKTQVLAFANGFDEETSPIDISKLKKGKPAKTVSEEEDEGFATQPLKKADLEEEEEFEEEEEEEEESDGGVSFDEVKEALNKYGSKKPLAATALLKSFGVNNSKELSFPKNKNKLEPVYKKLMGVLKAMKK